MGMNVQVVKFVHEQNVRELNIYIYIYIHQEEESFVALAYLALVEDSEYAEVHFLWPGQRRNSRAVLNIYYFLFRRRTLNPPRPRNTSSGGVYGVGGVHVHADISARCDELSSWRSIYIYIHIYIYIY